MPVVKSLQDAHAAAKFGPNRTKSEPVKLSFLKDGLPDPARPPIEIEAILRAGGGKEANVAGGYSQEWRTRLAAGKAELHIDRAAYSGPQPRAKDRVRALSRHGSPLFEVLRVDDRGETRLILGLGEV